MDILSPNSLQKILEKKGIEYVSKVVIAAVDFATALAREEKESLTKEFENLKSILAELEKIDDDIISQQDWSFLVMVKRDIR